MKTWVDILTNVDRLLTLPQGWDGGHGGPAGERARACLLETIDTLKDLQYPTPNRVGMGMESEIVLTWENTRGTFQLVFTDDADVITVVPRGKEAVSRPILRLGAALLRFRACLVIPS